MNKSVYSLMLFDEIVDKIDKLSSVTNTNRSQLINDILAEHLGLMTPEQKIQRIIENLKNNLSSRFSSFEVKPNTSIQFIKSLKFKYKPQIKFCFEFLGNGNNKYAVLKISSRTTSKKLNKLIDEFFVLIDELEKANDIYNEPSISNKLRFKFIKEFKTRGSINKDINEVSRYLSNYLKMIEQALNLFFIKNNHNLKDNFQYLYEYYLMPKDLILIKDNPIVLL